MLEQKTGKDHCTAAQHVRDRKLYWGQVAPERLLGSRDFPCRKGELCDQRPSVRLRIDINGRFAMESKNLGGRSAPSPLRMVQADDPITRTSRRIMSGNPERIAGASFNRVVEFLPLSRLLLGKSSWNIASGAEIAPTRRKYGAWAQFPRPRRCSTNFYPGGDETAAKIRPPD